MSPTKRHLGAGMRATISLLLTSLLLFVFCAEPSCDPSTHFVAAARRQVGKTLRYDPGYQLLNYPNGDVPMDRGVCTDVVIRAMRRAYGFDSRW